MLLRPALVPLALVLAAACTPNPKPDALDAPTPPVQNPAESYGEAPPPRIVPRHTLRPGDRDTTRAPVSLTASDGTGLKLVSLTARAVVEEPLAFTELRLVFENPNDRQIEGRFEIDLPPNAAISRFAMKIGGAWQEGEVVERRAAQVAYEDFLHRKQDPALLENKAGNSFSARVFPINARERKELIVGFSQELPSSAEPYRLMLRGLPELADLDARVILRESAPPPPGVTTSIATTAGAQRVIELRKQNWTPDQDLEVLDERGLSITALRHDNLAVARIAPTGETKAAPIGAVTVLFDTSASRALGFSNQVARLKQTLDALRKPFSEDFDLRIVLFDQATHEAYRGKASGLTQNHLDEIVARGAMGASNLEAALKAVPVDARVPDRVLLFTDGITTAGGTEQTDLKAAARALVPLGLDRIDAVIDGGIQDAEVLRQIATAELPHNGVVLDARLPLETIAHKLTNSTLRDVKVTVPGAAWIWPDTLTGLQPGDEALVYADLPPTAAMRVILEGEDRIDMSVPTTNVERPLLERAWVGARIERLTSLRSAAPLSDTDTRGAYFKQIVELSTRFRVLSDFTALLVLETENDYRRFGIDRNALSDILTVDANGINLLQRKDAPVPAPNLPPPSDPSSESRAVTRAPSRDDARPGASDDADVWGSLTGTEVGDAYGVGGLGLVGTGRGGGGTGEGTIGLGNTGLIGRGGGGGTGSGYGRGAGAGFGGRGTRVPTVRQARAEVQGNLDRDIIRRIVRAHINEIRYCYNQTLARDPNDGGRVLTEFVIGSDGRVVSAQAKESTLKDNATAACIATAIRRWTFPRPEGGGTVTVSYPFILDNGGASSTSTTNNLPSPISGEPESPASRRERAAREAREAREEAIEARREAAEERRARLEYEREEREEAREEAEQRRRKQNPFTGEMKEIMALVKARNTAAALTRAHAWRAKDPGDVLALIALGEAYEAAREPLQAARAYGSIIDLFPARADLRRYAGARLERLGEPGLPLAIDTFAQAVAQRPDHPQSHRLHAYALARAGRHADAFAAILKGHAEKYPPGRFNGIEQILRDDVQILAAAWIAADPKAEAGVNSQLAPLNLTVADKPSLRFILNWETDANDVDFHITDRSGEKAWYSRQELPSGGELYEDVTTGYGPECFIIPGTPKAFPYKLEAHYYSRGPMGYGMGKLEVVQHDGKGGLKFEERPFIIMQDDAFVDLGTVTRPL
jgi:tetratricopeptide (TPR) repeat protein